MTVNSLSTTTMNTISTSRLVSVAIILSALILNTSCDSFITLKNYPYFSSLFETSMISLGFQMIILAAGSILFIIWYYLNKDTETSNKIKNILIGYIRDTKEYLLEKSYWFPKLEISIFIVITMTGGIGIIFSSDLISIFLTIELQSFAVYVLTTLYKTSYSGTRAGLTYFFLGGLSSCLLLLGVSLAYTDLGVTNIGEYFSLIGALNGGSEIIKIAIIILIISLIFKISAAPFHQWAPDVYDGAPTTITTWLAVMPKISILALISVFYINVVMFSKEWIKVVLICSLLSIVIGSLVGLKESRLKRLLAYSTVSQIGYLLLTLTVNSEWSLTTYTFYIIQYTVTSIAIFWIILGINYTINKDIVNVTDLSSTNIITNITDKFGSYIKKIGQVKVYIKTQKIFNLNPILTISITIAILSLAGVPPMVGFFAKIFVIYTLVQAMRYIIVGIVVLTSVFSAYYYLNLIRIILFGEEKSLNESDKEIITNVNIYIKIITEYLSKKNIKDTIHLVKFIIIEIYKKYKLSGFHSFGISWTGGFQSGFVLIVELVLDSCYIIAVYTVFIILI